MISEYKVLTLLLYEAVLFNFFTKIYEKENMDNNKLKAKDTFKEVPGINRLSVLKNSIIALKMP